MVGFASMLILTTSIARVKSIFIGKDYDMLASMPLTKREIIASKIITFYLTELLFSAIIMVPNIIINVILWDDLTFIPIGTIILFLLPAFPVALSCFIGTLISLFAERSKFGNIITTILYTLFFVAVMGMTFFLELDTESDVSAMIGLTTMFKILNPTSYLLELSYTSSVLWFIVFCIINILLLAAVIAFIALSYEGLHDLINSSKSNIKYERKKLENKSQFKALLSLEFKRLFNSRLYFLNSCIGGILVVLMSVMLGISFSEVDKQLITELGDFIHLIAIILMFILGMSTPAACAINMEGKCFWIAKTLPIDYRVYAKAKIATSVIFLGLCSLVASIILVAFIQPTFIQAIAIIALPILYVIAISSGDLLINLFFYKLNWKNEQEAVKNSAATMLSMLAGFISAIIIGIIMFVLSLINMYLSVLVSLIALGVLAWLLYYTNMQIITKRIETIEQ
jgi:ABC-2 type transport system permease protein